jgi:predicted small lipoprotein YifL
LRFTAVLIAAAALLACGQKGTLVLPDAKTNSKVTSRPAAPKPVGESPQFAPR